MATDEVLLPIPSTCLAELTISQELLAPLVRFASPGEVLDVGTSMQNGLLLLAFLEDWTGIHYPKNPQPKTDGDKYKNVTIALQALMGLFDMAVDLTADGTVSLMPPVQEPA